jgi:cytochrome c oxidase subunit II
LFDLLNFFIRALAGHGRPVRRNVSFEYEISEMKKIGFVAAMILFALALLSTRYYMVDLPIYHFISGGEGPEPSALHLRGEFVESNLGAAEGPSGSLTVRMIAQQFVFVPQCVVVPAGVPIAFRITSADVVHMLSFLGTDYGLKVVPGAVTEATFTFAKAGTFKIPCHEFCGAGHYAMRGQLNVVPRDQFASLLPDERRTCELR